MMPGSLQPHSLQPPLLQPHSTNRGPRRLLRVGIEDQEKVMSHPANHMDTLKGLHRLQEDSLSTVSKPTAVRTVDQSRIATSQHGPCSYRRRKLPEQSGSMANLLFFLHINTLKNQSHVRTSHFADYSSSPDNTSILVYTNLRSLQRTLSFHPAIRADTALPQSSPSRAHHYATQSRYHLGRGCDWPPILSDLPEPKGMG